jgi:hypothetical protein
VGNNYPAYIELQGRKIEIRPFKVKQNSSFCPPLRAFLYMDIKNILGTAFALYLAGDNNEKMFCFTRYTDNCGPGFVHEYAQDRVGGE